MISEAASKSSSRTRDTRNSKKTVNIRNNKNATNTRNRRNNVKYNKNAISKYGDINRIENIFAST